MLHYHFKLDMFLQLGQFDPAADPQLPGIPGMLVKVKSTHFPPLSLFSARRAQAHRSLLFRPQAENDSKAGGHSALGELLLVQEASLCTGIRSTALAATLSEGLGMRQMQNCRVWLWLSVGGLFLCSR